jgi:putative membrane protein
MRYFMSFANVLMIVIWGILLVNLFFPFPGKVAIAFNLLLAFTFIMHLLQLLLIYGAFAKQLQLTKADVWEIFLFGSFKLWEIKKRLPQIVGETK